MALGSSWCSKYQGSGSIQLHPPLAHGLAEESARGVNCIRPPPGLAHRSAPHRTPHSLQRKARKAEAGLSTLATHPQAHPKEAPEPIILCGPSRYLSDQLF